MSFWTHEPNRRDDEATVQDADIETAELQAAAAEAGRDDEASIEAEQAEQVRRTTAATAALEPRALAIHLFDSVMLDAWPSNAAVIDWGIDSPAHLGALQDAVRGGATAADLDEVCGDGPAITAMVRAWQDKYAKTQGARYRVTFATAYDVWDAENAAAITADLFGELHRLRANWADGKSPIERETEDGWEATGDQVAAFAHEPVAAMRRELRDVLQHGGDDPDDAENSAEIEDALLHCTTE
jgi:hypothetical protein